MLDGGANEREFFVACEPCELYWWGVDYNTGNEAWHRYRAAYGRRNN